ncbi:MAG: low molecular weight phosphotyrosine protein phosphatase [Deltaproteobacteria bacterium]|nr:low molecular weight phosphotyrosine protein phosphatase [Deltaproteobacteria bacterium]
MAPFRICFVCLGNICRSPLAEAVLQQMVRTRGLEDQIEIESRGTGDWHLGQPADPRMQAAATRHGVPMSTRAELFEEEDFADFDLILSMDRARFGELERRMPRRVKAALRLFRDYDPEASGPADVPDPYYGGEDGFEEVYRIVERTCAAMLDAHQRGELP